MVVFFFKQKTAYEMRISDWSSDVCSSDLPPHCLDVILRRLIGQLEFGARKGCALEKPNQLFRLLWILDDAEELDHGLVEVVVELRFRRRLLQHHRGAAAERLDIGHIPGDEAAHPRYEPPLSPVTANYRSLATSGNTSRQDRAG